MKTIEIKYEIDRMISRRRIQIVVFIYRLALKDSLYLCDIKCTNPVSLRTQTWHTKNDVLQLEVYQIFRKAWSSSAVQYEGNVFEIKT